jgi:hypothetical protein
MKCSTEAKKKMAEILVQELPAAGLAEGDIRSVETGMREILREVGTAALGQYLKAREEELRGQTEVYSCGREEVSYAVR